VFTARYGLIAYIKRVFMTVLESVYSVVGTDCLYKAGFFNGVGIFTTWYGLIPYVKEIAFRL
jgi:hypothetical protein